VLVSPDPTTIGAPDISTDALFWALRLPTVQGDAYFPKRTPDPSALTPQEKTVLLHLADHADTLGECFPSVGFLSRKTGLAESSVRKYLRRLQDRELIHGTEQTTTAGRTTSTLYRLALPDLEGPVRLLSMDVDRTHRETAPPPTESRGGTHRETVGHPPGDGGSSFNLSNESISEPISASAREKIETQGLDVWWGPIDAELKRRSRPLEYAGLFADLRPVSIEDGAVTVFPPSQYVGEKVQTSIFFWRILEEIAPDVPVKIQDVSI
jgi:hypothetical protein